VTKEENSSKPNTNATIEELLEVMFSMQSVPRLYKEKYGLTMIMSVIIAAAKLAMIWISKGNNCLTNLHKQY
jgi:hypothetical protein